MSKFSLMGHQSKDIRDGMALRVSTDPYRKEKRMKSKADKKQRDIYPGKGQDLVSRAPPKPDFSPHVGLFDELKGMHKSGALGQKFLLPPFSIFDARSGWWQERKRAWLELGIQSELGRGADAPPGGSKQPAIDPKTGKICRADSRGRPIPGTIAAKHRKKQ